LEKETPYWQNNYMSKDGNIILLNDGLYEYKVPLKMPSDEKEIINYQLKKKTKYGILLIILN